METNIWILIAWILVAVVVGYKLGRMQDSIIKILEEIKELNREGIIIVTHKKKKKTRK